MRRQLHRPLLATAAALVLALLGALLVATPAHAAATGSISGRVLGHPTGGTPAPLAEAQVWVYPEGAWGDGRWVRTAANGTFAATGLADGTYLLRTYSPTGPGYAGEYYDDGWSPYDVTPVVVSASRAVRLAKDIVLQRPGAVTGRVTDEDGRPLAGATVSIRATERSGGYGTTTDANGYYDSNANQYTRDLKPGSFVVEASTWSQDLDAPVYGSVDATVTVQPDGVTVQDFVLPRRRTAVFTVLDPAGKPVAHAPLSIHLRDDRLTGGTWEGIRSGPHDTDETGRYRFVDGFDEVKVKFHLPQGYAGPPAVGEWWEDAHTLETARVLTFSGSDALRRDFTVRLDSAPPVTAGTPRVTGTPRTGRTLDGAPGSWGPRGVDLDLQWLANGSAVPGATGSTFRVTNAQAGKRISLRVTGTVGGRPPVVRTSAATAAAVGRLTSRKPTLAGKPVVGRRLVARAGAWRPKPVQLAYAWFRDGARIKGATQQRYLLTRRDAGHRISVKVTGSKKHFARTTAQSARTAKVRR